MPDAKPYSKQEQLGAGRPKRYRRKVASPKQWEAIREEKLGPCRVCESMRAAGLELTPIPSTSVIELHHLVSRAQGGDDTADNLIPLCRLDHRRVEANLAPALRRVAETLTDAEYAYVIGKLGDGALTRLFGVMEPRP